jgi:hypothetical protein
MVTLHEITQSDHKDIKQLLLQYFKISYSEYTIDNNGFVSTTKQCMFLDPEHKFSELPVKFLKTGSFHCYGNALTSLNGSPMSTTDSFSPCRVSL